MASLKECRAKAKKLGLTFVKLPEKDYWYKKGERYKAYERGKGRYGTNLYGKTVADISKMLSAEARRQKKGEMMHRLNAHRAKYGYKTVPRKKRGKV